MIDVALVIAAFVCFVLAAIGAPVKVNLVAAGLACYMATLLF